MDSAPSTSGSIPKNLAEDRNFYQVPPNLYEFNEELSGRRSLIVKESNLLNFRKYKAESNDSKFFCCDCYYKNGSKTYAYFSNGILRAPRIHCCEATPISKLLKKVKTEEENPGLSGPSSRPAVIRFDDPLWNGENSEAIFSEDLEENRPLSRESDIIILDEINSSDIDATSSTLKEMSHFRSVGPDGYEKAYSNGGTAGNRLIVFEENDLCNVKQYAGMNNKYWYCLGCFRISKMHTKAYQQPDGTFLVPKEHDCNSITYEEAKKEQEKIIEKWNIGEKDGSIEGGNVEGDASTVNEPPKNSDPQPDMDPVCSRLRTRTPPAIILPSAPRPLGTFRRRRRQNVKSPSSKNTNKRHINASQYEFGFGATNKPKGRLFVFENIADKSHVHEYSNSRDNSYYCRGCFALDRTEKRTAVLNKRTGALLIPCNHICETVLYENVQKEQDLIKQRYANRSTSSQKPNQIREIINRSKPATENSSTSKPNVIRQFKNHSRPAAENSSTPSSSSAKKISPPIYSGVRLAASTVQNQSINISPPAPIIPPRMSDAFQSGVKRNADERSKKDEGSSAAKKIKPTESQPLDDIDGDVEKPEDVNSSQATPINSNSFKQTDKIGPQRFENSATPPSANSSTSMNKLLLSNNQILYFTKPPSTFSPVLPNIPPPSSESPMENSVGNISSTKCSNSATLVKQPIPSTPNPPSTTPISDLTTSIKIYIPSSFFFEKCCEKLNILYTSEAYKFWLNIKIKEVSPESIPDKIHSTSENIYHGWECFSLYITGDEEKAGYIREKVNVHLYNDNSESLFAIDREIEGKALFSPSITSSHLQIMAKWFGCRIGIFVNGKWTKYGNWTATDSDVPTMLIQQKDDGKYAPILSLK